METEQAMTLNLTPRISQDTIFHSVVSNLNKHRRGVFGPPEGFKMILFLDNLGLPLPDKHGDQPATELVHQPFLANTSLQVKDVLMEAGLEVNRFARFEVGEIKDE